jgi:mono/diheme cytochrome c family protein
MPAARSVAGVLGLCALLLFAVPAAAQDARIRQGEYVFRAAGCAACHTDSKNKGAFLAGGRALETPFGILYAPNITPDRETGIGNWSDAEFVRAMTEGVSPAGKHYYPAFPYTSYTQMRREDVLALKAYLFSVPAVKQANRPNELPWYLPRLAAGAWKALYFTPGAFKADAGKPPEWNRGAYLVTALSHCAECHSPRNTFGAIEPGKTFIGTTDGPDGDAVPNLTPDNKTGLGNWSRDDLVYYLKTGADPDGDYAGGLMAEVIDEGLSHLTEADLQAIADYLRSLPPVENRVGKK